MNDIKIAVIDSGISLGLNYIDYNKITFGYTAFGDYIDYTGHGTNIVYLIQCISPNANIVINKVFNQSICTKDRYILEAIQWCIENKVQLINLSIAIKSFENYFEILSICQKANKHKVVIVAAAENFGNPCLPAYLDDVIGVGGAFLEESKSVLYLEEESIKYYGKINNVRNDDEILFGTSYATANISGIICEFLEKVKANDIQSIKKYLKNYALTNSDIKYLENKQFDFHRESEIANINKYCEKVLLKENISTLLEKLTMKRFQHRIRRELNGVCYNDFDFSLKIHEKNFIEQQKNIAIKYNDRIYDYISKFSEKHIYLDNIYTIVILNISHLQSLSIYVMNSIDDFFYKNNTSIKHVVSLAKNTLYENFDYYYNEIFANMDDVHKWSFIKMIKDTIKDQELLVKAMSIEVSGNIQLNSENFNQDKLDNYITLLAAKANCVVIIYEEDKLCKKIEQYLAFIEYKNVIGVKIQSEKLLQSLKNSNEMFRVDELEDVAQTVYDMFINENEK